MKLILPSKYTAIILLSILLATFTNSIDVTPDQKNKAKDYIPFARLPYCKSDDLKNNQCKVCDNLKTSGFVITKVHSETSGDVSFTMVVSYSSTKNEAVVSFAGPKSDNIKFLQKIYTKGFTSVKELGDLSIEEVFWTDYSKYFRNELITQVNALNQKNKNALNWVFVGHSFGGSIATLAIYDMTYSKILTISERKGPFIYTFGALKMGREGLLKAIQTHIGVAIVRVRRKFDFFTLIPRCVFVENKSVFHCYTSFITLVKSHPNYGKYFYNYSDQSKEKLIKKLPEVAKKVEKSKSNSKDEDKSINTVKGGNKHHSNDVKQSKSEAKAVLKMSSNSNVKYQQNKTYQNNHKDDLKNHHDKNQDNIQQGVRRHNNNTNIIQQGVSHNDNVNNTQQGVSLNNNVNNIQQGVSHNKNQFNSKHGDQTNNKHNKNTNHSNKQSIKLNNNVNSANPQHHSKNTNKGTNHSTKTNNNNKSHPQNPQNSKYTNNANKTQLSIKIGNKTINESLSLGGKSKLNVSFGVNHIYNI